LSKALAAVAVALVLAAVLYNVMNREREASRPQDAVFSVMDSARAGDVSAYVDGFAGAMRDELAKEVKRRGQAGFAEYLREQVRDVAGVYIGNAKRLGEGQVELEVDLVFPTRAEKQRYLLVKGGREWKISDVRSAEYSRPVEEYGAPVSGLFPEDEAFQGSEPAAVGDEGSG